MLGDLIDTYLPLNAREHEELRIQWEAQGGTTMEATKLTWADEIMLRNKLEWFDTHEKDV